MRAPLRIALISPTAWPPRDDVAHQIEAEALALARRGHRVTILAPATARADIAAGRAALRAAQADPESLSPPPGEVLRVSLGRAVPAGPGRRVGEPFDLSATLETLLSRAPFDVVHLHEPLAPSPGLASLRHAPAVTAATFHRAEPLAGVAFLRPLVDRALGRLDVRIAGDEGARAALVQILPGDYLLVAPGVDLPAEDAGADAGRPPGLVLVARGRDRVGVRFALGVLRGLDPEGLGPVSLVGPPDAPWRTRAAVPKRLRELVRVVPDAGPAERAALMRPGDIVVIADPADATGPALREAMAAGAAIVAPARAGGPAPLDHGVEGLVEPPFVRDAWIAAVEGLRASPERRRTLGAAARERAAARTWDAVAADLERAYADAIAGAGAREAAVVRADLRVRGGEGLDAAAIVARATEAGLDVVAVAGPGGLDAARAAGELAPPGLSVIAGQEIATTDGMLVGLFLAFPVADGLAPAEAADAVHAQGGVVLCPHPGDGPPTPAALRELGARVDVHEVATAGRPADPALVDALRARGLRVAAGSGARRAADVGSGVTELPPFADASGFLAALDDARLLPAEPAPHAGGRRRRSPRT